LHEELNVVECHENKFADQLVEDQDVVPFSLVDNNIELFDPPRYDEYDDDFLEQPILDASSKGDSFQEANDNIQPICHSYLSFNI
jgi:hypothetical protein